mgnify:CR=1 FL=1
MRKNKKYRKRSRQETPRINGMSLKIIHDRMYPTHIEQKVDIDEKVKEQLGRIMKEPVLLISANAEGDIYVSKAVSKLLCETIDNIDESIRRMEKEMDELWKNIQARKRDYELYISFMKRVKVKGGDR